MCGQTQNSLIIAAAEGLLSGMRLLICPALLVLSPVEGGEDVLGLDIVGGGGAAAGGC